MFEMDRQKTKTQSTITADREPTEPCLPCNHWNDMCVKYQQAEKKAETQMAMLHLSTEW